MTHSPGKTVRIGGACAFVGDSIIGPQQLIAVPGMQYLVFDYLAEMTLSSFAHARQSDPQLGYSTEFIDGTLREILMVCQQRGIRLVANAGGLNPAGCAQALMKLQQELGTTMKVAHVEGDDCMALLPYLRESGTPDFYSGDAIPAHIGSANAYLGALPIARALDMGADVVITGRIVDSATTLGVLMHEYGWSAGDHDALAMGSLAGHILECGPQATGGIHTDWRDVPRWEDIGYPIVDFHGPDSFTVSKPAGTGGMVTRGTVSEQILYEIGDPARYMLPDVTCDFTAVTVTAKGENEIEVRGARGTAPSSTYKVSATCLGGWRCVAQISIFGMEAIDKARRTTDALLARTRSMLAQKGWGDFDKVAATVIGAEDSYGPHAGGHAQREAIARVAVIHQNRDALELFSRESRIAGVSFAPGTTSGSALNLNSRPAVEPLYKLYSFLLKKSLLAPPQVVMSDGRREPVPVPCDASAPVAQAAPRDASPANGKPDGTGARVPLIKLAWGRSGDKGDISNIAIIARHPRFLPLLEAALTPSVVKAYLGHLVTGGVVRYDVPGIHALNFVMDGALDGGGPTSLRTDPMGKGMAQQLLEIEIEMPQGMDL